MRPFRRIAPTSAIAVAADIFAINNVPGANFFMTSRAFFALGAGQSGDKGAELCPANAAGDAQWIVWNDRRYFHNSIEIVAATY
jgi:hypothetical protein